MTPETILHTLVNFTHRHPETPVGEVIDTKLKDGVLYWEVGRVVLNEARTYAVDPNQVLDEVAKGSKPVMD